MPRRRLFAPGQAPGFAQSIRPRQIGAHWKRSSDASPAPRSEAVTPRRDQRPKQRRLGGSGGSDEGPGGRGGGGSGTETRRWAPPSGGPPPPQPSLPDWRASTVKRPRRPSTWTTEAVTLRAAPTA